MSDATLTEIVPPTPYGFTIFCDDIREEIRGKMTYAGIYSTTLVAKLPVALPKFCMAVHYFESLGESDEDLELRVFTPDSGDEPFQSYPLEGASRGQASAPQGFEHPRLSFGFGLTFTPMIISKEGFIRVRMVRGGKEIIKLGSLRVIDQNPDEPLPT